MAGNEPRSMLLAEDEESAREVLASLLAMTFRKLTSTLPIPAEPDWSDPGAFSVHHYHRYQYASD